MEENRLVCARSTLKRNEPNQRLPPTGMNISAFRKHSAPAPEPQRSAARRIAMT